MELEDRLTVPSPEGIDLDLVLAGLGSRSVALLVDLLAQMLAIFVLGLIAGAFGDGGQALAAVGAFLVLLGYPVLFEAFHRGQTLGKAWLGIAVVDASGTPVRFIQAVIRNVVRFVDILPGTYLVGLVSVLATSKGQRVGDLAAGTIVIRRPRVKAVVPHVAWPVTGHSARAVPLDGVPAGDVPVLGDISAVTPEEVAAIRAFLDRRAQLTPLARQQLADTLATQVISKVAGIPLDGGPEAFLERVVVAAAGR